MLKSRHGAYRYYNHGVVGTVGVLPRPPVHGCYEYWWLSACSCPLLQSVVLRSAATVWPWRISLPLLPRGKPIGSNWLTCRAGMGAGRAQKAGSIPRWNQLLGAIYAPELPVGSRWSWISVSLLLLPCLTSLTPLLPRPLLQLKHKPSNSYLRFCLWRAQMKTQYYLIYWIHY